MGNAGCGGCEPGGKRPARDARWRIGCYRGWPGCPYLRQGRGARLVGSRPCGIEPTVRSRRSCERRGCGAGPLDRGENCRNPPCQTGDEPRPKRNRPARSEEHTSELQSLMRISYAVFCLKKKKSHKQQAHYLELTTIQA